MDGKREISAYFSCLRDNRRPYSSSSETFFMEWKPYPSLGRGIPARGYEGDKKKKILNTEFTEVNTELHRVLRRKSKPQKAQIRRRV